MSEEKVYQGWRSPDGQEAYVTVNGEPLRHVVFVSPTGMEWGYMGAAPTDLALSILTDHLGDEKKAQKLHREFKEVFVATWGTRWRVTGKEISGWVREQIL
jgi:hypothetical protein